MSAFTPNVVAMAIRVGPTFCMVPLNRPSPKAENPLVCGLPVIQATIQNVKDDRRHAVIKARPYKVKKRKTIFRAPMIYHLSCSRSLNILLFPLTLLFNQQGRSDGGGYRYLYPPPKKTAQVNFLWGKMTSERLFNSFIHPKNFDTPPKQISGYAPVNQLLSVAAVPQDWRNAVITPVLKKGFAGSVTNYRPISLTSVINKILERVISRKTRRAWQSQT